MKHCWVLSQLQSLPKSAKLPPALAALCGFIIFCSAPVHAAGSSDEAIYSAFFNEDYAQVDRLVGAQRKKGGQPELLRALSLAKLGRGPEAQDALQAIERNSRDPGLQAAAAVARADIYYAEGKKEAAYLAYQHARGAYPFSQEESHVQAMLAELAPSRQPPNMTSALRQVAVETAPYFSVQVGSFSREKNALALAQKLSGRYDAYVEKVSQGRLYRVRVGHVEARDSALELEKRLQKDGYSTKIYP